MEEIQREGLAKILVSVVGGIPQQERSEQLDLSSAYNRVTRFLQRQDKSLSGDQISAFYNNYANDDRMRQVVNDIDQVEQDMEAAAASRDSLESLIRRLFLTNKKVTFNDNEILVTSMAGDVIPLEGLSSGEKHVIDLLLEVLLVNFNTLLIDEPEISLHVDWQRNLISYMTLLNPGAQLIIATHSPDIMAEIPQEKIFRIW